MNYDQGRFIKEFPAHCLFPLKSLWRPTDSQHHFLTTQIAKKEGKKPVKMRNFHAFKTGVSAILARLWNNFVKCILDVNEESDLFISAQRTPDAHSYILSAVFLHVRV